MKQKQPMFHGGVIPGLVWALIHGAAAAVTGDSLPVSFDLRFRRRIDTLR